MSRFTATATRRQEKWATDVEVDGHELVVDEPADEGGADTGPSPTRLVAAGLAACTAITVQMYADRKGWKLDGLEVEVDADTDAKPATFHLHLKIPGDLDDDQVERLRVIAGKCPVHRMLKTEAQITDSMERV